MTAQDLASYQWKNRLVLLFAGKDLPRQQAALAKESAGLY